ncbi:type II toxin-antitoxin system RelE/ParE family toxin [Nanoarchaeota archaeon]
MLEVRLDKQPEDFLKKCEKELFNRLRNRIGKLGDNPVPQDAKRVVGYKLPAFRVRVGKYRVLYRINYDLQRVVIVKIDSRDKVY